MSVPVFDESIGGALIDAARISTVAALAAFPEAGPAIVVPGEERLPDVSDCLEQALQWLEAARALTVREGPAPTSLHVIEGVGT